MSKSGEIIWAACIWEARNVYIILVGNLKRREHFGDI
jgi:hypothetical protein